MCEHLFYIVVITSLFIKFCLRKVRLNAQQALEDFQILCINLLELLLTIIILPNGEKLSG